MTISSDKNLKRDHILEMALKNIPTPERVTQIWNTIKTHIEAEENNDIETTLKTMVAEPVFEDVAAQKVYRGHASIKQDYIERFKAFPSMNRKITNISIDNSGAWIEMIWEGLQKGPVQKVKPIKDKVITLPITVYMEVNAEGLISRESCYYDQYLAMLNLEIIPDIKNNKPLMIALKPSLLLRLSNESYR